MGTIESLLEEKKRLGKVQFICPFPKSFFFPSPQQVTQLEVCFQILFPLSLCRNGITWLSFSSTMTCLWSPVTFTCSLSFSLKFSWSSESQSARHLCHRVENWENTLATTRLFIKGRDNLELRRKGISLGFKLISLLELNSDILSGQFLLKRKRNWISALSVFAPHG